MAEPGERLFYRVPDLVRLTGYSEPVIRHLIEKRIIPSRRLGRRVIVLPHELRACLQRLRRPGEELDEAGSLSEERVAP